MMKRIGLAALLALTAAPALAQTPPATLGARYVPAPWWMQDPVIASTGRVRVEIAANRAAFSASFQAVDRSVADASRKAADQVRALSQALAAYGVDVVRVETALTTRPLYDQYRDENGVLRDNVRADRIERYQADASVSLTLRDMAVLERVYATVVASQPTSISQVNFSRDAGATLGPVRVIDPTGRACQTDVLAGWPSYQAATGGETTVDEGMVTGLRAAPSPMSLSMAPPAPPPPPSEANIEAARLALQPPLRVLTDSACVVYSLN